MVRRRDAVGLPTLCRRRQFPLLVLATLRTEELGQQNTWRAFCWHCSSGQWREQELGPLSPAEAALAANVGGRP